MQFPRVEFLFYIPPDIHHRRPLDLSTVVCQCIGHAQVVTQIMPYFYSLCIVLALAVDRLFKLLELLPNEVLRIHRHAQVSQARIH